MIDEKILHLTDGTTVSAKVNFATLYYMRKSGVKAFIPEEGDPDEDDALEIAARMLYVLLCSNGRTVTFQEALVLCPIDIEEVQAVFDDFRERLEAFKKKQDAKQAMRQYVSSI
ncbi:MAG: hypothetical protein IJI75_03330 [Solobacterium sp.]|nr:hypothetical protein [Solobacterium sp.]